jgi:hypothetical protein
MHTVENGTSEVTEELLEKVGLLTRDFVEAITLPAVLDIGASETSTELSVEDCANMLAIVFVGRWSGWMLHGGWFGGAGCIRA